MHQDAHGRSLHAARRAGAPKARRQRRDREALPGAEGARGAPIGWLDRGEEERDYAAHAAYPYRGLGVLVFQ
ncbi:hypothetical protein V498_10113 [Pseudogymnoascus sp. VKM F-4517 (FW-2822)]|nr:hypothetical protein V498_10113 [Pseudogymnoascus sp. VKM F-4517 (FW-2822)]